MKPIANLRSLESHSATQPLSSKLFDSSQYNGLYRTASVGATVLASSPPNSQSIRRTFAKANIIPSVEDSLWLIERGIARTITWSERGDVTGLGYWGEGEVVGPALSNLMPFQIECLTSVEVLLIPRDKWSFYLDAILRHGQQMAQLMSFLAHEKIPQRLVYFLNWLGDRFGREVSQGLLIDLPLTHATIAEMVGTTRVTVSRYLGEFRNQGAIICNTRQLILRQNLNLLDLAEISIKLNRN
jgi:CRP-like cAMP-binding protein